VQCVCISAFDFEGAYVQEDIQQQYLQMNAVTNRPVSRLSGILADGTTWGHVTGSCDLLVYSDWVDGREFWKIDTWEFILYTMFDSWEQL